MDIDDSVVGVEEERVEAWRLQRALELGFTVVDAERLARSDVDLHELERMIGTGCKPELALRILL